MVTPFELLYDVRNIASKTIAPHTVLLVQPTRHFLVVRRVKKLIKNNARAALRDYLTYSRWYHVFRDAKKEFVNKNICRLRTRLGNYVRQ